MEVKIDFQRFLFDDRKFRFSKHSLVTNIYGLFESQSPWDIRYIGKTDCLRERLSEHIKYCQQGTSHKDNWIKKAIKHGKTIDIVLIKVISNKHWRIAETDYILAFRKAGYNLTNVGKGGEGGHMDENTRKLLSAHIKSLYITGKRKPNPPFSEKHCENIRKAKLGMKRNRKSKNKQGRTNKSKKSIWINNGKENKYWSLINDGCIPNGWKKGRIMNFPKRNYNNISEKTKRLIKKNHASKRLKYITNGTQQKMIPKNDLVPKGWRVGQKSRNK